MSDVTPSNDTSPPVFSREIKTANLRETGGNPFDVTPTVDEQTALAALFKANAVAKVRFAGKVTPLDKGGWQVAGTLGASVTQDCVITLDPVRTRIDVPVRRSFLPDATLAEQSQDIDPDDDMDEVEVLTDKIDLGLIATEAISLALPDYPKAEGASLAGRVFGPEGVKPMTDDDAKPFAGLSALRDKLAED